MIANLESIKKLLNTSVISQYRIAKESGVSAPTLQKYASGKSKIENMSLINAIRLTECYENYKGVIEMENKISEIIAGVENWKVELDSEYDLHEVREEEYISHWVEGDELEVYFAEKQFVKDAREEKTVEELLERLNDLEDRFNYDKVVAYDAGSGVVWL
ncbi:hypothetical protein SporoP37_01855 [Sporosarcina sp. P37]|uniref:hypothetical protein n=1 Tax=unclassified Sporosarcina TaxID=2647733 RepID=UPI000A17979F|nr:MULTISPECIES: hypothetical protein [unclassified Sporosarcina]ARK23560.1 hypothetical protein SporoP37_01855 [Sporosarcina sp. P37]